MPLMDSDVITLTQPIKHEIIIFVCYLCSLEVSFCIGAEDPLEMVFNWTLTFPNKFSTQYQTVKIVKARHLNTHFVASSL